MKMYVASLALFVLLLSIVACSESEDGESPTITSSGAIDQAAILGSLEDVRALVRDSAGSLDPNEIGDVEYADGELRVTLADGEDNLDTAAMQGVCGQISQAVALPNLTLTVEKADGSDNVSCQFSR